MTRQDLFLEWVYWWVRGPRTSVSLRAWLQLWDHLGGKWLIRNLRNLGCGCIIQEEIKTKSTNFYLPHTLKKHPRLFSIYIWHHLGPSVATNNMVKRPFWAHTELSREFSTFSNNCQQVNKKTRSVREHRQSSASAVSVIKCQVITETQTHAPQEIPHLKGIQMIL